MSCSCDRAHALRCGRQPFQPARRGLQQQRRTAPVSCRGSSRQQPQQHAGPDGPWCARCCAEQTLAATLAALQLASAPLAMQLAAPAPAEAVLNSPNARIARRYAIAWLHALSKTGPVHARPCELAGLSRSCTVPGYYDTSNMPKYIWSLRKHL